MDFVDVPPVSPPLLIRLREWLQEITTITEDMLKIVVRKRKVYRSQNMGHVVNLQAPSQLKPLCDLTLCKLSNYNTHMW